MLLENYPEPIEQIYEFHIPKGQTPERLDTFLTRSIHNATRNKVQVAIEENRVLVGGFCRKSSYKITPNDHIVCKVMKPPPIVLVAENLPLNIIYEDDFLLVLNKSAGMCVHPGVGNRYGTLLNALLFHFGISEAITIKDEKNYEEDENDESLAGDETFSLDSNRPYLVHRIDKDTTGLLVIAKTIEANLSLATQFANKTTQREYNAIVWGKPKNDFGRIEGNIGRSPRDRKSFAVVEKSGKPAITNYEVLERFAYTAFVRYKLHTGRTHQIRVHSAFIGHKLFGDVRYGGDKVLFGAENPEWRRLAERAIKNAPRQMLHAKTLGFLHPKTQKQMLFSSELPEDMQALLAEMREKI